MRNQKNIFKFILVLCILGCCSYSALAAENQESGMNKAANLRALAQDSENYIVTLEPKEFL